LVDALAPLPVEVSLHTSDPPNPWKGYQRILSNVPGCSHLLIVQEDVAVCHNFPLAVIKIADANPDRPVILFLARLPRRVANNALRAAKRRERYLDEHLRINEFCPVVGILWPAHKAQEFLAWTDANPGRLGHPEPRSDDGVLGRWVALTKQTVRFAIPSLIQHPDDQPSVIGRRAAWGKDGGRVALMFCQDDPLALDWSC
jgi:hypothetical protein